MMITEILALLDAGATLTVCAHDTLNPGHGHFARIENPDGSVVMGEGVNAADAMGGLAQALARPRGAKMIPTVHLNGTSGGDLYDAHLAAMNSIREAIDALRAVSPNPRDFYVQGDSAYARAREEHVDRLRVLEKVSEDLQEITVGIMDQLQK